MTPEDKQSSIVSLNIVLKWSSFCCMIPWYDFNQQRLVRKCFYKSYAVFLTCLIILLPCALKYYDFNSTTSYLSLATLILYAIMDITNILFWITLGLRSAFWNMSTWQHVFKVIHSIKAKNCEKEMSISKVNLIFLLGHVDVLAMIVVQHLNNYENYSFYQILRLVYVSLQYYLRFIFSNLIFNMITFTKYKYGFMCKIITNLLNSEEEDKLSDIRKTKQLLLTTLKIINDINQLFGWPLLLLWTHFGLDCLNGAVLVIINFEEYKSTTLKTIIIYIIASKVRDSLV